jgi:chemotaxis protein MotB
LHDPGRACDSGGEIVSMLRVARWLRRPDERSSGHGGGSGGRWLVSYADFVTLMFGFFLILWASATQDPVKFSELALAFRRAFNTGAMVGMQGTGEIVGKGGRMGEIVISPVARISETAGEMIEQMGLTDDVSVGMRRDGLVITLSGSLLFESGQADLRPESAEILSRLANLLEPTQGKIRIEGHSDNIPIATAAIPSNWELSSYRASAVLRYLTETVGLPANRFEAAGFAEHRPLVPNDTRENRAKNRRVEIILVAARTDGGELVLPDVPPPAS